MLQARQKSGRHQLERKQRAYALPLPARMPRVVVLDAFDPDGTPVDKQKLLGVIPRPGNGGTRILRPSLTFVDYEWDGTLGTAFTKLSVKNDKGATLKKIVRRVERKDSTGQLVHVEAEPLYPTQGYDVIVDKAGGYDVSLIDMEESSEEAAGSKPMVLIAQTHNDASKLAIQRGDVVTHVNGEEFMGTAEDLNMLIKSHYAACDSNNKLEIVVNAEVCVAQALKFRSLA